MTGVIDERLIEPGDLALPGKPLVRLYDPAALRVELRVPEELSRAVAPGTAITVRVEAAGENVRTIVNEVVPAADPASRTFLIRAPLAPDPALRPGMFARASLRLGDEKVLTVARGGVESVGQLETARVLSAAGIQVRQLALGRVFGKRVEVLAGLDPGERVLVENQGRPAHE